MQCMIPLPAAPHHHLPVCVLVLIRKAQWGPPAADDNPTDPPRPNRPTHGGGREEEGGGGALREPRESTVEKMGDFALAPEGGRKAEYRMAHFLRDPTNASGEGGQTKMNKAA